MSTDRTYEDLVREYNQARADNSKAFREYLIERGVTITSPDHLAAEQANYNLAHHDRVTAMEQLGIEFAAAGAERERRLIEAHELAARAHDTNARWAAAMDDRLKSQ